MSDAGEPIDAVVVGAGAAGLAVSACLRQRGIAHAVLDREDAVGAVWQRRYSRLHLHTVKRHSALPFAPWPREVPTYPTRDQVVAYLQDYARRHAGPIQLNTPVRRVQRAGDRFVVEAGERRWSARAVVVASGLLRVPQRPSFPGLADFRGRVVHSSDYRDPQSFIGQRTLVVGCGNSGAEIALDLAEHGVPTAMVVRGPVHVVPRDLLGRPTQPTNILLSGLPLAVRDAIAGVMLRFAVGDLRRWGIERPAIGPNTMIERFGRIPLLDIGTIEMVKRGRIQVVPGVREVRPDGVLLADGRLHACDAIVLATGYTHGLADWLADAPALLDERGRPRRFGGDTELPGLHIVGFRNPPTGTLRSIALEAPRVAEAIAQRVGSAR